MMENVFGRLPESVVGFLSRLRRDSGLGYSATYEIRTPPTTAFPRKARLFLIDSEMGGRSLGRPTGVSTSGGSAPARASQLHPHVTAAKRWKDS
jgi:hypothetical protein